MVENIHECAISYGQFLFMASNVFDINFEVFYEKDQRSVRL